MRNSSRFPHFDLLSQAVRVDVASASQKAIKIMKQQPIDWDHLYFLSELHTVRPQLYRLLKEMPVGLVPESIMVQLHTDYRGNVYLQLQNTSEYLEVQALLENAGVEAVPFKGFSLANSFYDNPGDRESVDVDLYIDPADLYRVKQQMFKRGYAAEEPLGELSNDYILAELCEYNFDKYDGDSRLFHFEFHWRLSLTVFGMNITLNDLQEQVVKDMIQQRPVKTFSASAHLLLAILHHGGKDQFTTLKHVLDIANILQSETAIDWPWVTSTAKRFYAEKLVYVAINLSAKLAGCGIPAAVEKEVKGKTIQKLTHNRIVHLSSKRARLATLWAKVDNFYFQLRSRNNSALQANIILHELRRNIIPSLIPKNMHHFFINKKIRQAPTSEQ